MRQCPCCGYEMMTFVSRADFLRLKEKFPQLKWRISQSEAITVITGTDEIGNRVELLQTNLVKMRINSTIISNGEFIRVVNGKVPKDMTLEEQMSYCYGPHPEDDDE